MFFKLSKEKESISALILIFIIFIACIWSDNFMPNSALSFPLIVSALACSIITQWAIPRLQALRLRQIIRKEGPQKHQIKAGTPTMGGLFIVPLALMIGIAININSNILKELLAISCLSIAFMFIGGVDDWSSLKSRKNKGLSVKGKLFLQLIVGLTFLIWASLEGCITSNILLVNTIKIDIGILIWPLALFVLLAESNATNLTDGLDGLASGCGSLVFAGLGLEQIFRESNGSTAIASFCMAIAGGWLGFLIHNKNPAKIFMGDTGSLAMGAALSGIALISNSLWVLLLMGGIFVAEAISVLTQVWVFKLTKQFFGKGHRIFLMAPIHHHFELKGKNEGEIVRSFWLVTMGLIILGILLRPNP